MKKKKATWSGIKEAKNDKMLVSSNRALSPLQALKRSGLIHLQIKTDKYVPGVRTRVLAVWHGSMSLNFHPKGFQCWLKEIA